MGALSIMTHFFVVQPLDVNRTNFEKHLCELKFENLSSAVKVIVENNFVSEKIAAIDTTKGRVCARLSGRTLQALEHTHKGEDFPPSEWTESNSKFNFETKKMLLLSDIKEIGC